MRAVPRSAATAARPVLLCGGPCHLRRSRAPRRQRSCDERGHQAQPSWPCGSWHPATAASSPCSTAKTSCSQWRAPWRSRTSRGDSASRRTIRRVPGRGVGDTSGRRRMSRSRGIPDAGHDRGCATRRVQALRNFPTLRNSPRSCTRPSTSRPATRRRWHSLKVDFELRAADRPRQLLELLTALLASRKRRSLDSVCYECKLRARVHHGPRTPCLARSPRRLRRICQLTTGLLRCFAVANRTAR